MFVIFQQQFILPDGADRQCVCIDESVLSGFPDITQIVLRLREGTPFDASDLFVVGCEGRRQRIYIIMLLNCEGRVVRA